MRRESLQNARAAICFNFIALLKQKEWKRKLLVWMNSKLLFSHRGNECRGNVWTVNKINRLRNQSTHSWEIKGKKHLFSQATARWSNYLLSLTALSCLLVLVSLLCWLGSLSSIPATIFFHWKYRLFDCHLMKADTIDFFHLASPFFFRVWSGERYSWIQNKNSDDGLKELTKWFS